MVFLYCLRTPSGLVISSFKIMAFSIRGTDSHHGSCVRSHHFHSHGAVSAMHSLSWWSTPWSPWMAVKYRLPEKQAGNVYHLLTAPSERPPWMVMRLADQLSGILVSTAHLSQLPPLSSPGNDWRVFLCSESGDKSQECHTERKRGWISLSDPQTSSLGHFVSPAHWPALEGMVPQRDRMAVASGH